MTDSEKEHFSIIREWKSFIGGNLGNFRKILFWSLDFAEQVPEWPYNFGWKLNLQKVINRSFLAEGDGVTWEVKDMGVEEIKKIDMYWVSGSIMSIERQQSEPMEVCAKLNLTYDGYQNVIIILDYLKNNFIPLWRLMLAKKDLLLAIQWKKDLVFVEKIVPDQVWIYLN